MSLISQLRVFLLRLALGLLALTALFAAPARAQDLFVASKGGNALERITPTGMATPFAAANLSGPTGLAFDKAGNLYVANNGTVGTILKFAPDGTCSTYYTLAGAKFQGLAIDSAGALYAASSANNSILKITAANMGTTYYTGTGANALNAPHSLAFDKSGALYVGNIGKEGSVNANCIVKITAAGASGTLSKVSDGTVPVVAYGLAFDSAGSLYAANAGANNVLKYVGGAGQAAVFVSGLTNPHGAAFDGAGNLYVANTTASPAAIVKITPAGVKTTFAASGLNAPVGLAFSPIR